jgi:hypothetical protein
MTTTNTVTTCPILFSTKNPQILYKYTLTLLTSSIRSLGINLTTILLSTDYINLGEVTYTR